MNISNEGLSLIKLFEGLRLKAYRDVAGIWTIGYGHIKDVVSGMTISEGEAEALLRDDLKDAERAVERLVKAPINENEFSALVSLVFNIGEGKFAGSTTLRRLNAGNRKGAADAIELWNKATINGKLKPVLGLVRRRAAEKALFLKPMPDATSERERGPESGLIPTDEKAKTLAQSRTIKGAATTAAGGAVATGAGIATQMQQKHPLVQQALDFAQAHANELLITLGAIVLLASLYVLYARIDDWSKGKR